VEWIRKGSLLFELRQENGQMPPNNSMQRTALRAAADAERYTASSPGTGRPAPQQQMHSSLRCSYV
jgi:hypothetical protein